MLLGQRAAIGRTSLRWVAGVAGVSCRWAVVMFVTPSGGLLPELALPRRSPDSQQTPCHRGSHYTLEIRSGQKHTPLSLTVGECQGDIA